MSLKENFNNLFYYPISIVETNNAPAVVYHLMKKNDNIIMNHNIHGYSRNVFLRRSITDLNRFKDIKYVIFFIDMITFVR